MLRATWKPIDRRTWISTGVSTSKSPPHALCWTFLTISCAEGPGARERQPIPQLSLPHLAAGDHSRSQIRGQPPLLVRPPQETPQRDATRTPCRELLARHHDWGKLLGDTAAVTALLDRRLSRPRAQVRAAKLAHESPDRLAHGGRRDVELPSLGRWPRWSVLPCRLIVGFSRPPRGLEIESGADWAHVERNSHTMCSRTLRPIGEEA